MEKEQELYQPKEVVEMTNIETETLRKYVEYFNIQTEWTKPNQKGHRRYTKDNINKLINIKSKIHEQGWSWKQVFRWLQGDEEFYVNHEETSRLENKMNDVVERLEKQEDFNAALVEKLDNIIEENTQLRVDLKARDEEKDKLLLETLEQKLNEKKEDDKKGFFSRLFGM